MKHHRHRGLRRRITIAALGHLRHHIHSIGHPQEHLVDHGGIPHHAAHHLLRRLRLLRSAIRPRANARLTQIIHRSPRQIAQHIRLSCVTFHSGYAFAWKRLGRQHDARRQL